MGKTFLEIIYFLFSEVDICKNRRRWIEVIEKIEHTSTANDSILMC